jgi:hypothetical protein
VTQADGGQQVSRGIIVLTLSQNRLREQVELVGG